MIDLDHFKLVKTRSATRGDTCCGAPRAIRSILRGSDACSGGGEKFALMLETADRDGVTELLERAREAVKRWASSRRWEDGCQHRSAGRCTPTTPTNEAS